MASWDDLLCCLGHLGGESSSGVQEDQGHQKAESRPSLHQAHYISSEATDVALKYHESALLLQAQDLRNQSIQRLCISTAQQITQIREREEGSIAPAKLDVSISFDAEGEGFHHEQVRE